MLKKNRISGKVRLILSIPCVELLKKKDKLLMYIKKVQP